MLPAETMEGTEIIALCTLGAVYVLLPRDPLPVLITPEPAEPWTTRFRLRWPGPLRPGHRRAAEEAGEEEADTFIRDLHGGEDAPRPGPGPVYAGPSRHRIRRPGEPKQPGRHRAPGPPNQKLRRDELPSMQRTIPVRDEPGGPWARVTLLASPQLAAEPEVRRSREPRPYTGPEQEDPPTSVWSVREVLDAGLGSYLDRLPHYEDGD